jgi:signal transduction histidine kinase
MQKRLPKRFPCSVLLSLALLAAAAPLSARPLNLQPKAGTADTAAVQALLNHGMQLESVNLDSALATYRHVITLSKAVGYPLGVARGFHYSGIVYADMGSYDSAMAAYQHAIILYGKINRGSQIGSCYLNIANLYQFRGNYQKAMDFYFRSIKLFTRPSDRAKLSVAYSNLGVIFQKLGQYGKASGYYTRAVDLSRKINDSSSLGNGLINLGAVKELMNRNKEALTHFLEADSIGRNTHDLLMRRDALTNIGEMYFKTDRPEKGFAAKKKALAFADQLGYPYDISSILISLGEHAMDAGRLKAADHYLRHALSLATSIRSNTLLSKAYLDLSLLEFKQHRYRQAYLFQSSYKQYSDSVFNEQQVKAVNEIETKYETAQKNKEIAEQNLALEKNREAIHRKDLLLFLFLAGIILLGVILTLSVRSYRHKQNLHRQSLLTMEKQHELDTLKTKMDAREEERGRIGREMHDDIGSALTTILYLSHDLKSHASAGGRQTADRIAGTAESVVDKMNEIIWSMNREYDTLDDLVAYSRQHAAEFLDDHGLEQHFETPEVIPDIHLRGEQRRNIYLVIKETLHNIVKHACATRVSIDFQIADSLTVIIHDNGKGIDGEKLRRFGNGLRNMKQRMESVGGSFRITSEGGTTVTLQCPLQSREGPREQA